MAKDTGPSFCWLCCGKLSHRKNGSRIFDLVETKGDPGTKVRVHKSCTAYAVEEGHKFVEHGPLE